MRAAVMFTALLGSLAADPRGLRGLQDTAETNNFGISATTTDEDGNKLEALASNEVVQAKFIGNVFGHAKMLCTLVKSIDCWQNNPDLPFGFSNDRRLLDDAFGRLLQEGDIGQAMNMVQVYDAQGSAKFAEAGDLMKKVKQICQIVDKGIGGLPELLPKPGNGGGGWFDKIPLIGKIPGLDKLFGSIPGFGGGGDKPATGKGFFDLIFKNIGLFDPNSGN